MASKFQSSGDPVAVIEIVSVMSKNFREDLKKLDISASGRLRSDFDPFYPTVKKARIYHLS